LHRLVGSQFGSISGGLLGPKEVSDVLLTHRQLLPAPYHCTQSWGKNENTFKKMRYI